jgi:hypothetical protein
MSIVKRRAKQSVVTAPGWWSPSTRRSSRSVVSSRRWARCGCALAFAQLLLKAVGEDAATPQNQLLARQMAIESLRARWDRWRA